MCGKKGHVLDFCPSRATRPRDEDRSTFVDMLVNSPRVRLDRYRGLSWEEAWERLFAYGSELNKGNPWCFETGPEFHLKKNLGFWKAIGADRTVMSWVGYGVDVHFCTPLSRLWFANSKATLAHESFIEKELNAHLEDGLAKVVDGSKVLMVHPMLVVDQNGKLRLCDDLRFTNGFQASPSFQMQSLEQDIPEIVQPGEVMVTKDLQKAYYKVMMTPRAREYQNRYWKGKFYQMCCLLFGMCNAPFVFTKLCRPLVRFFGAVLLKVINFIDDFLMAMMTEDLERIKSFFEKVFLLLGWSFNDKGEEGSRVNFLGYIVDSVERDFIVPERKIMRAMSKLQELEKDGKDRKSVKTDNLLSLLGQLGSMRLAIPAVSCWTRSLYTPWKGLAPSGFGSNLSYRSSTLIQKKETADSEVLLTSCMREEIEMLLFLLAKKNGAPFMSRKFELDIFCDSSEIGWGAFLLKTEVTGLFGADHIGRSSTFRELGGLIACLQHEKVQHLTKGKVVRINMDSKPAVANLTKNGGPVSELCALVKVMFKIFQDQKISPVFRWLSRETMEMRKADALSKEFSYTLRAGVMEEMSAEFQCEITCPKYGEIPNELAAILASGKVCGMIVPVWEAKSWWTQVVGASKDMFKVGKEQFIFRGSHMEPNWEFSLALFF